MKSFAFAALLGVATATNSIPTAIFHGMGDACRHRGMKNFTKELGDGTGAYSACVESAAGMTSIMENFEEQAKLACDAINKDEHFSGEFNVVGLSQGGLLARSIATQCKMKGKVRNLLSIGGPNMGVDAIPHCVSGPRHGTCC